MLVFFFHPFFFFSFFQHDHDKTLFILCPLVSRPDFGPSPRLACHIISEASNAPLYKHAADRALGSGLAVSFLAQKCLLNGAAKDIFHCTAPAWPPPARVWTPVPACLFLFTELQMQNWISVQRYRLSVSKAITLIFDSSSSRFLST